MKHFIITLFACLLFSFGFAQGSVQTGTLEFNGAKYPSESVEYNIPEDDMTTIIKNKMQAAGYTPEKTKGFLVYRNVTMSDFGDGAHDVVFKIDQKSRKEKGSSIVNIITAAPGEIPVDKVKGGDKTLATITTGAGASTFLMGLQPAVGQQAHNIAVLDKAKEVEDAQKKLDKLKKEQASLEKKIRDAQSKLDANLKDQQTQSALVQSLQASLQTLKNAQPQQ